MNTVSNTDVVVNSSLYSSSPRPSQIISSSFPITSLSTFQTQHPHQLVRQNRHVSQLTISKKENKNDQWRSKVGAGPVRKNSKRAPSPLSHTGFVWTPHSDGPACTARLAHPIATPLRKTQLILTKTSSLNQPYDSCTQLRQQIVPGLRS